MNRNQDVHADASSVLLSRLGLNRIEKEFIAEEIQRADKADTRIIASLKHRDQRCSFANRCRVLGKYIWFIVPTSATVLPYLCECGLIRIGGVGCRRTREDVE